MPETMMRFLEDAVFQIIFIWNVTVFPADSRFSAMRAGLRIDEICLLAVVAYGKMHRIQQPGYCISAANGIEISVRKDFV